MRKEGIKGGRTKIHHLRRNILIIVLAVLLALAAAVYFFLIRSVNVYVAIPNSAIAVIEADNWNGFLKDLSSTPTGNELKKTELLQRISTELSAFRELLGDDRLKSDIPVSGKMVASLHLISADAYDILFTVPVKGVSDKAIIDKIQASKRVRAVNIRIFKGQKVMDVLLNDGRQLTVAKLRGMLALSFTPFLTENSVSAILSNTNLQSDKDFRRVKNDFSGHEAITLFINFSKSDVLLPISLNEEKLSLLKDINQFAGWGAYGINIGATGITITGLAQATASTGKATADKNILESTLFGEVPDNAAFVNAGFNSWDENALKSTPDIKYFKEWVGTAHAFVVMEPLKGDFTEQNVFIAQVNDKEKALESLKPIISAVMSSINDSVSKIDSFRNEAIFRVTDAQVINRVFGNNFAMLENPFVIITKQVAIFCNNEDKLKMAFDKINNGECLAKTTKFQSATETHPAVINNFLFVNPERAQLMFNGLANDSSSLPDYLASFSGISVNNNINGEWITSTVFLKTSGEAKPLSGILWKTKLQAASVYPPQVVLNVNSGEREIFAQDTSGNIYLLNKAGEILFTKNIGEQLVSGVYQLDYYNNGKLQYIFNTANHIYIVDRFGNYVSSFPIKLSYPATAGLTLVLDTPAREYRYYVPCSNGAIYGYETNGKPIAGWSPKAGTGSVNMPVQCIREKNINYLLVYNASGKLTLFDGRGNAKWSVANLPSCHQNFSIIRSGEDYVLLNAAAKQLVEISSDGNDQVKPLVDSAYTFAALSTNDSSWLYYFANQNQVRYYDNKAEFKSAVEVSGASISKMEIIQAGDRQFLSVRDDINGMVHLYTLQLEPVTNLSIKNIGAYYITDLYDNKEVILLSTDLAGNISCSRL